MKLAHRHAWELSNGPMPDGTGYHGTCVLHRCDNRACCNPAHLFLGSNADNCADRDRNRKRRQARGERNNSRLTERDVADIRANYVLCRVTKAELSRRFGVSAQHVGSILAGRKWRAA